MGAWDLFGGRTREVSPRRILIPLLPASPLAWLVFGMTALGGAAGAARGASGGPGSGGTTPTGRSSRSALATVPYMGWNTYYGVGGIFDEHTIMSVARALLDRGLARAGYRIVWLDFGWGSGQRNARGRLGVDPHQWPHGLRWLTGWLHRRHLLAGIYTDAGTSGCHGQGVRSLGHYQQDVN